jgi:hypothetical protein
MVLATGVVPWDWQMTGYLGLAAILIARSRLT